MVRHPMRIASAVALVISPAALAQPSSASLASAPINPRANDLFDRDPLLRGWAVRLYDSNQDGWLTLFEAQPALAEFRDIADGDRDGQVTPSEFARAKAFIAARW